MNAVELTFIFFTLTPNFISFGCCDDFKFSLCWTSRGKITKGHNNDIFLNDQSLRLVGEASSVASVTVPRGVEHNLTVRHENLVHTWTVSIDSKTTRTKVKGDIEPRMELKHGTKVFQILNPTNVFPCENNTIIFLSDANFTVVIGSSMHLDVTLESRTPSSLLLSWVKNIANSTTTLYHSTSDVYRPFSVYNTTDSKYNFTGLDTCTSYVACVERETALLTCLFVVTDPKVPQDFRMTTWNSSSVTLVWSYPEDRAHFLLTAFYLNGTDHIINKDFIWHNKSKLEMTISNLPACSRVKFGLQTFCQKRMDSHYSSMVQHHGNSLHSSIEGLCQTAYGPDNYTLSWDIGDPSSISKFKIYNDGQFYGFTTNTNFTVGGLHPCQQYHAKVVAMCGDDVVLNVKMATAHTGLEGVSGLSYHANDSTASWTSSLPFHSGVAFLYELSENGTTLHSNSLNNTALHLPTLEQSKSYVLDVWEQCDGLWESRHSRLCFRGNNLSLSNFIQSYGFGHDHELPFDIFRTALTVVVPLPDDFHDISSEQRLIIEGIFEEKLEKLMEELSPTIDVEVTSFEPAEEPGKTAISFVSFDSEDGDYMPLLADEQLDHIKSLGRSDLTVKDHVIYWQGPDLCALVRSWTLCPQNSLCINTLGSYSCVCRPGYYDVSYWVKPSVIQPVCNENGLFSQCLETFLSGGIAKSYLESVMNGKMDLKLNDGRCKVEEGAAFYYFNTSRHGGNCGTEKRVNRTHFEFKNRISVSLRAEEVISRRDLKIVWVCVYPRHYVRNAQVSVAMERLEAFSVVQLNSSLQLSLALYTDVSFTNTYNRIIRLWSDDFLFVEVRLQTNKTFASDVLVQLESCWATETSDPDNPIQGVLLQDSCPVDPTFQWHSDNGQSQQSRFSVRMFYMPERKPFYIHCRANVCGPNENCVEKCSSQQRRKRSVDQDGEWRKQSAVLSAGPVVVNTREDLPSWTEYLTMIFTVAGSIGLLGLIVLFVSTTKAIMNFYERLRLKRCYQ